MKKEEKWQAIHYFNKIFQEVKVHIYVPKGEE